MNKSKTGFSMVSHQIIDSGLWAELSPKSKAAYLVFCRHAHYKTNITRIGNRRIALESGISIRKVSMARTELAKNGLIKQWQERFNTTYQCQIATTHDKVVQFRLAYLTAHAKPINSRLGSLKETTPPLSKRDYLNRDIHRNIKQQHNIKTNKESIFMPKTTMDAFVTHSLLSKIEKTDAPMLEATNQKPLDFERVRPRLNACNAALQFRGLGLIADSQAAEIWAIIWYQMDQRGLDSNDVALKVLYNVLDKAKEQCKANSMGFIKTILPGELNDFKPDQSVNESVINLVNFKVV